MRTLGMRMGVLLSAALTTAGCAGANAGGGPPGGLPGTMWLAVAIDGAPAADYPASTLSFPSSTEIAGSGGCNRFSGTLGIAGQQLAIGPLATTRKMCPPPVMQQETAFLRALGASTNYQSTGEFLTLSDATGHETLRLSRLTQPI